MEGGSEEGASSLSASISNRDIAMLLARFACNNHTIADEELRPIGVALYPLGALVNHSCTPNCMQTFKGNIIQFRALRPISPGEQITISYVELAATRQERRETLYGSYFFDINAPADASTRRHLADKMEVEGAGACTSAAEELVAEHGAGAGARGGGQARTECVAVARAVGDAEAGTGVIAQAAAGGGVEAGAGGSGTGPAGNRSTAGVPLMDNKMKLRPPPLLLLTVPVNENGHEAGDRLLLQVYQENPPWQEDPHDDDLSQLVVVEAARDKLPSTWVLGEKMPGMATGDRRVAGGMQVSVLSDAEASQSGLALDDNSMDMGETHRPGSSDGPRVVDVSCWGPWAVEAVARELREASCSRAMAMDEASSRSDSTALPGGEARGGEPREGGQGGDAYGGCRIQSVHDAAVAVAGCAGAGSGHAAVSSVAPTLLSLARTMARAALMHGHADRMLSSGHHSKAVSLLQQALSMADAKPSGIAQVGAREAGSSGHGEGAMEIYLSEWVPCFGLGPCHILRVRMLASLLKAAIDGSCWEVALSAATELAGPYQQIYPSVWPNLGLHNAALAKLEMFLEHPDKAFKAAQAALKTLSVTHGHLSSNSGVMGEVLMTLREAEKEVEHRGLALK